MKYLSIVFVAAIALVSCGGEVDACECYATKIADEEAWAADSAANAACEEAMAVEGALDSCGVADAEAAADADADAPEASNDSTDVASNDSTAVVAPDSAAVVAPDSTKEG